MFFHMAFNKIDKAGIEFLVVLTLKIAKGSFVVLRWPNDLWFLFLEELGLFSVIN